MYKYAVLAIAALLQTGVVEGKPPPPPSFDCSAFKCTCQGFMDYYGAKYRVGYGCATRNKEALAWYKEEKCLLQCSKNHTACEPSTHQHLGCGIDCTKFGCSCQGFLDYYGGERVPPLSYGCAPTEAQAWHQAEQCDLQCKTNKTGCTSPKPKHAGCTFDCTPFGCTCQGFVDYFGSVHGKQWGCATNPSAQMWYNAQDCLAKKVTPSVVPGALRGGCKCIDAVKGTGAGLHHNVDCGGYWRGFSVSYNVPKKCLSSACGLIVDVHGFTMDGDVQDANNNMRALGEENDYIVLQPNAVAKNWNVGIWAPPYNVEMVGDRAVNNVVQELLAVKAWNIDRNRIHLTGFSEGGWMTGRMLCNYQHLYKSFVMLAGASNADPLACVKAGDPQPPLLVNQGLNDESSHWDSKSPIGVSWSKSMKSIIGKWNLGEGKVIAGNATCLVEKDQFDCKRFGCTCQGFANWYGVKPGLFGENKGCANTATPWKWYKDNNCATQTFPTAYHGGCVGCYSRTRYENPSGVAMEVLSYSYVADYFLKGHCFPGSTATYGDFPFGCPGAQERKLGAKAAYNIGQETMKWFLAHEKDSSIVI